MPKIENEAEILGMLHKSTSHYQEVICVFFVWQGPWAFRNDNGLGVS